WNEDETVLEARKIIKSGYNFEMKMPYGVKSYHVYKGIMSEMPDWDKYYDVEKLLTVAKAVVENYNRENPEGGENV
ncbi:MAG: hypothetical protein NC203_06675, partial [Firmicutes bacterium]|nr:hypothetical protein [Bacillota bacterium]